MKQDMNYAIEISHLSKDYGSFRLEDVSFNVPGGTIVGLIGENGAGKSTTLKCILNLIRRDSGEIRVFGRDNIADERAIKEDVGVVLDESMFHDLLRCSDVGKILAKVFKTWDDKLFRDYLQKFELPEKKNVKEYSRGMKMKLSIAAALSHRPKLLILDEATGGLDPVVRNEILDEFLEFIQDEDHAILTSSHITTDLEKVADYVVYLHKGRVTVQGPKDELLDRYARLCCAQADLDRIDHALVVGVRKSRFNCEALINDRRAFARSYPDLPLDPVTLDEIMVFTVKGDAK